MSKIKLLPNNVINQIAAGEVIERPASVVKELLENSIDAYANQITLDIKDGGLSQIKVLDNGIGMTLEEMKMAFVRHATSKIFCEEDLSSIRTLGFRGEALPSIASVSEVIVKSKQDNDIHGNLIKFDNGYLVDNRVIACQKGTEITVSNIFNKIPARKKFLGTSRGESIRITDVFQDLVFSNSHISFTYIRDDKLITKTLGDGKLENVVSEVLGSDYCTESLLVDYKEGSYKVTGLISKPNFNEASRKKQFIYVNNRPIDDGTITHALEYAFGNLIPKGRYPFAILFLSLPSDEIDVNVHPNKKEVRFSDKKIIHSLVSKAVKNALLNKDSVVKVALSKSKEEPITTQKSIAFNRSDQQDINYVNLHISTNPKNELNEKAPFVSRDYYNSEKKDTSYKSDHIDLEVNENLGTSEFISNQVPQPFQNISILGQIHASFIVIQNKNGLALIDQHAAHERIIYHKLKSSDESWHIQKFAVPMKLSFTNIVFNNISDYIDEIRELGLEIESFGTNSFILRGMPNFLIDYIDRNELKEMLETIFKDKDAIKRWYQEILVELSCKAAIKIRQNLSNKEIYKLIEELAKSDNWQYCPHGRPTVLEITFKELEKMFKRV
jgi:DNA mismatch repair protein MutL